MGLTNSVVGRALLGDFLSESVAMFFFTIVAGLTFDLSTLYAGIAMGIAAAILYQSERAHLNPIISIAVALTDVDFGWVNLFIRILAQILGAILGGILAVDCLRLTSNTDPPLDFDAVATMGRALLYEIIFAAFLVIAFLRTRGTSVLAPFIYGLVYLVAIIPSNTVYQGNALLNPTLAFGLMLGSASHSSSTNEGNFWLFVVGPFIGCLLAIVFYQMTAALYDDIDDGSSVEETIQTTVYEDNVVARPVPGAGYETKPAPYADTKPAVQMQPYATNM